jgi:predicted MFS family arabinose efflux permease
VNAETVAIVALGLLAVSFFLFIERRAEEPILPLDLFHLRLFRTSTAVATLSAMGVFGATSYFPLYLQGVLGLTASRAGMVLLLLSLGWTAGSLLAGQLINRQGYRFVSGAGMALLALGFGLFVIPADEANMITVLISASAIGIGMGLANLTTLVAAQTAVWPQRIGVATSTIMLFRTFGGAFAVSLMGTVLFNQMHQGLNRLGGSANGLSAELRDKLAHPQNLLEPATRALIPVDLLPTLIEILADSIWYAFLTAFVLMLLGVVTSLFMGSYTPANTPKPDNPPQRNI